jgi:hypothetical protein
MPDEVDSDAEEDEKGTHWPKVRYIRRVFKFNISAPILNPYILLFKIKIHSPVYLHPHCLFQTKNYYYNMF